MCLTKLQGLGAVAVALTLGACEPPILSGAMDGGALDSDGSSTAPDFARAPDGAVANDLASAPDGAGVDGGEPATGATRYPHTETRSPITASVKARMAAIAANDATRDDDVFMKVGASGTVSTNLLFCFAGESQPQYTLDLGGRDALQATIDFFRAGVIGAGADATTPFDRVTKAALVGRTASWVIAGDPSPLTTETLAANPRFAFVNYGTNDMGLASTYQAALFPFYDNMTKLLDQLEAGGIVPIVSGLNPRGDIAQAARLVPTWDVVTRAMAEERQLPYLSLYLMSEPLANHGLLSDGLHGNVMVDGDGKVQPCNFSPAGLQFNYDVRNLASIDALDRVKRVVLDGEAATDVAPPAVAGKGTAAAPFVIDALPFSHSGTTTGAESAIDSYPGCGTQDESGPEVHYRLTLPAQTAVRVLVFDRGTVDVDVHLLAGASCTERNDRIIERTLLAGEHDIVVDSFVSGGVSHEGKYLLVVVACEPGDTSCD